MLSHEAQEGKKLCIHLKGAIQNFEGSSLFIYLFVPLWNFHKTMWKLRLEATKSDEHSVYLSVFLFSTYSFFLIFIYTFPSFFLSLGNIPLQSFLLPFIISFVFSLWLFYFYLFEWWNIPSQNSFPTLYFYIILFLLPSLCNDENSFATLTFVRGIKKELTSTTCRFNMLLCGTSPLAL